MRSTALESLTILHHSLNSIGIESTSETLCLTLNTLHYRYCHPVLCEVSIYLQHLLCLLLSLLTGSMSCVTFLPKELRSTEEWTSTHLPTHYVTPLVAKQRQIAPRVNPVLICVPDDSLRCRTNDKLFLEFGIWINNNAIARLVCLQTIVSYNSTLLSKALNVLSLTTKERLRDKKREICILHTSLLEHLIQLLLHLLPDSIAVRFDYHTTTYCRLLCEISLHHEIIVPLTIIVSTFCEFF